MFEANQKMVYLLAGKMSNPNNIDDLIQEGFIGLLKAEETYCEGRGTKPSSWAYKLIFSHIMNYLAREAKLSGCTIPNNIITGRKNAYLEEMGSCVPCEEDNKDTELVNDIKDFCRRVLSPIDKFIFFSGLLPNITQEAISNNTGISQQAVSRRQKNIINKICEYLESGE